MNQNHLYYPYTMGHSLSKTAALNLTMQIYGCFRIIQIKISVFLLCADFHANKISIKYSFLRLYSLFSKRLYLIIRIHRKFRLGDKDLFENLISTTTRLIIC